MNWEAIGAIGEIVGAAAVVATLIYLAIQTRRTREATEINGTFASLNLYSEWRGALAHSPDLARAVARSNNDIELSEEEQVQLQAFTDDLFIVSSVSYANNIRSGSVHDTTGDIEYVAGVLRANPGLIEHWQRFRQTILFISPDYVALIDKSLATGEPTDASNEQLE